MQTRTNDHRNLWLLAGTGDGPVLAEAFVRQGWNVTVSVVSLEASSAYVNLPLVNIRIGSINGVEGIKKILNNEDGQHRKFDWVVDATHPFALVITADLVFACKELGQPLVRYERPLETPLNASLISSLSELSAKDIKGSKFLCAIGSRQLDTAVRAVKAAGGIPFARVFPSQLSLKKALASGLDEQHIAVTRPSKGKSFGEIELALCRRWSITSLLCRQSGGVTQSLWQDISLKMDIDLWLIKRPLVCKGLKVAGSITDLLTIVGCPFNSHESFTL